MTYSETVSYLYDDQFPRILIYNAILMVLGLAVVAVATGT
jgi:uncharacterized membrane protein YkvI